MKARKTHKGSIGLLLDGISAISVLKKLVPDSIKKIAGLFPGQRMQKELHDRRIPVHLCKRNEVFFFPIAQYQTGSFNIYHT